MSDWLTTLANQAKQLADNLTDTIVTQANAAKDEFQHEQMKIRQEVEKLKVKSMDEVSLPWETDDESLGILSQPLMEKILKLSLSDRNFIISSNELSSFQFTFKEYIPIAMKLLGIDSNLSRIHAKLSPKMDEEIFWLNYYQRCMYLRSIMGFEGVVLKERYQAIPEDSVIFVPSFEADYMNRKDLSKSHGEEKNLLNNNTSNSNNIVSSSSSSSTATTLNNSSSNVTTASNLTVVENSKAKDEEEAKLVAEVEEELNNTDIDLADLEDINGDDDFENIGADDVDEDLEAQIARELGELED